MPSSACDGACRGDKQLAYMLQGSHNLSQPAWGTLQKQGAQLHIQHYELGVLLLPSLEQARRLLTSDRVRSQCMPRMRHDACIAGREKTTRSFLSREMSAGGAGLPAAPPLCLHMHACAWHPSAAAFAACSAARHLLGARG
jgi:hypothetical protein